MDLEDQDKQIITSHLIVVAHLDLEITWPEVEAVVVVALVVEEYLLLPMVVAAVVEAVLLGQMIMVKVERMDLMVAVVKVLPEVSPVVEAVVQVQ